MLFHITTPEQWEKWTEKTHFEAASFPQEGFIHLCTQEQISGVLERYFEGIDVVLVLYLDPEKFESPLKWEIATGGESFPHLYGPVNQSAIIGMESLTRGVGD